MELVGLQNTWYSRGYDMAMARRQAAAIEQHTNDMNESWHYNFFVTLVCDTLLIKFFFILSTYGTYLPVLVIHWQLLYPHYEKDELNLN